MTVKLPKGWYDLTIPLKQGMPYLVLDPVPPKIYRYSDVALGSKVTMSMLEIISHTGTHIDSPLHFIPGGSTISDMDVTATIGPCRVIEIKDKKTIKVAELEKYQIKKGERLLFKTINSPTWYTSEKFYENYVYLDGDAAEYLGKIGIRLFGIDSLTIGYYKDNENINRAHLALLSNGCYILEGLAMGGVPAGDYELLCLPLLMYNGDAGPSRVILRPMAK
jgi:arylformamidase